MTKEQRDKIVKLARKQYELIGCVFPKGTEEMIEYLYNSGHPDEIRCLLIAIEAHNVYCNDEMDESEFYDWHGL